MPGGLVDTKRQVTQKCVDAPPSGIKYGLIRFYGHMYSQSS